MSTNSDDKHLIYAVDDESSIRELYSCALENSGFEAVCFCDAEELFAALKNRIPDLILLDIMLDGMDGYKILEKIKTDKIYTDISIIMVSAKSEEINRVKGLNSGADDYIIKPFGIMELIARINANLRKKEKISRDFGFNGITVCEDKHEIYLCGKALKLTLKEYDLLKFFVEKHNKVLRREEMLSAVWSKEYSTDTRALDMHIKELRKKLDGSGVKIVTVRGVGYALK